MRLTIVPSDKKVGVDNVFYSGLDLSSCAIPANIHALQWYETEGEVEFVDNPDRTKPQNELISELPVWANSCITKWNEAKVAYDAAIAAAQQAAVNQPQTTGTQTA
jgi:hypothetical protein